MLKYLTTVVNIPTEILSFERSVVLWFGFHVTLRNLELYLLIIDQTLHKSIVLVKSHSRVHSFK